MKVMGIDQGLALPGIALLECCRSNDGVHSVRLAEFQVFSPPSLMDEVQRMSAVERWVMTYVDSWRPQLVGIEQPATARANRSLIQTAGVVGAIRIELYRRGLNTIPVQPSHMKKMFTGSGTAKKDAVVAEALERFGARIFRTGKMTKKQKEAAADAMGVAVTAFLDHWALPGKEVAA